MDVNIYNMLLDSLREFRANIIAVEDADGLIFKRTGVDPSQSAESTHGSEPLQSAETSLKFMKKGCYMCPRVIHFNPN
jgi:hypothetical protein